MGYFKDIAIDIVTMYREDGMKEAEIAKSLGLSLTQVHDVLTGINILNAIEFKKRYSSRIPSQVVLVVKESNNFNNLQTDHIVANSGISRKLSNISKIKTKQSHNITLMVLIQSALNIFGNFIIIIIIYFVICNLIFFILIYTKKTRNGTIFDFKHIKLCIRFNTSISNLL